LKIWRVSRSILNWDGMFGIMILVSLLGAVLRWRSGTCARALRVCPAGSLRSGLRPNILIKQKHPASQRLAGRKVVSNFQAC